MRLKSLLLRSVSSSVPITFLNSSNGVIHSFSESLAIIASMDLSCSTIVQTQHPNLLFPQLGSPASTIIGHSPSAVAPLYIVSRSLLSYPQGFLYCIRKSHTSLLFQFSSGEKTNSFAKVGFGLSSSRTRSFS